MRVVQLQGYKRSVDRSTSRQGIEPRNVLKTECRRSSSTGRQHRWMRKASIHWTLRGLRPLHAWKFHVREPGGPASARHEAVNGPVGEGDEPEVQHERW